MCLADFAPRYISEKIGDMPIEPNDNKIYTLPVSNINALEPNPNTMALKNELLEIRNVVDLVVFVFTKFD